jgi:hypothetical protein
MGRFELWNDTEGFSKTCVHVANHVSSVGFFKEVVYGSLRGLEKCQIVGKRACSYVKRPAKLFFKYIFSSVE